MTRPEAGMEGCAVSARQTRVEREVEAAKKLMASGTSEIEEVLEAVADRLDEEARGDRARRGAMEE